MPLKDISLENKQIEDEIQQELYCHINNNESVIFNSGAGAGKTYALVECLKYIINEFGMGLKDHNQKVICITYTNVATNHIKEKLGYSELVKVSTIHERIWDCIHRYQNQLVELHKEKLSEEIEKLQIECLDENKFAFYTGLSMQEKEEFRAIMLENKEVFYTAYSLPAKEFRSSIPTRIIELCKKISDVSKFKSLVSMIYRIKRFQECLLKIETGELKRVEYNAMYNEDRLEWMRISHDTVLEYGLKMVERHPRLRQIIIDQYPYFLVDEYQDTSENVIKILDWLDKYSKEIKHDFFVAYFGDSVQSIYEDGVGSKIFDLHEGLKKVNKVFNRRSYKEIIDVANKIRKDEIEQVSIYSDAVGGKVSFFNINNSELDEYIRNTAEEWKISKENPLNCLFTLNKTVAERSGFIELYSIFENASAYKGSNWNQLSTETLSDDPAKLGVIQNFLRRLMVLYIGLKEPSTSLRTILVSEDMYEVTIIELRELIGLLKGRNGNTLGELLCNIIEEYEKQDGKRYSELIRLVMGFDDISMIGIKNYIQDKLYKDESDEEKIATGIDNLMNIDLQQLEAWYKYISSKKKEGEKIVYHTYHSTKGLEFENVIIVMEKGFGRTKRDLFESYFKNYDADIDAIEVKDYEYARNLFYVATTRAIKNLKILYVDDVNEIQTSIEKIFG